MNYIEAKLLFEKGLKSLVEKNYQLSIEYFENALKLSPNRPSVLKNLVIAYLEVGNLVDAEKCLEKLIIHNKKEVDLISLINKVYKEQDKVEHFHNYINTIEKDSLDKIIKLKKDLFLPKIYKDKDSLLFFRSNYEKNLNENLLDSNLGETTLERELFDPPIFQLSYSEFNNKDLFSKTVKLLRKIYPELRENEPILNKKNSKIKIGFISEFFCNHTIGKLFKGIIFNLDQTKFDIIIFHSHQTEKTSIFKEFLNKDTKNFKNIILPKNIKEGRKLIENQNLDILFFTDIGMSSGLYYYSFFKLAKTQMTTWGHPETSGNEMINYFLSSKLIEVENAQDNYTEKLLLTSVLPMYFYKPKINNQLSEAQINTMNIYSCPQSLFKIHPDFDLILKSILKKDKKAKIYFLKDRDKFFFNKLYDRFKKTLLGDIDRCLFLDQLSYEDFINHCGSASVILDPYYFGSGTSFHETMFYGTPTVSKPTKFMKSRVVLGAYKQMEIKNAPIAKSDEEYVDLSIEIANDKKKNLELKKLLRDSAEKKLYENKKIISEIDQIFERICINSN